jgi:hypothetical protein
MLSSSDPGRIVGSSSTLGLLQKSASFRSLRPRESRRIEMDWRRGGGIAPAAAAPADVTPALQAARCSTEPTVLRACQLHFNHEVMTNFFFGGGAFTTGQAAQRAPQKTTGLPLAGPDQFLPSAPQVQLTYCLLPIAYYLQSSQRCFRRPCSQWPVPQSLHSCTGASGARVAQTRTAPSLLPTGPPYFGLNPKTPPQQKHFHKTLPP